MLLRLVLASLALALTSSAALATTTSTSTHPTPAMTKQTMKKMDKDGEIIGILLTLNQNEIDAGKAAADKTTNADVKDFANMMVTDHTQNLDDTKKISEQDKIHSMSSSTEKDLQKQGQSAMKKLSALQGEQFDKAYIDDMVKGHSAALVLIMKEIPKAQNPDLKAHLEKTKDAVAQHLQKAKEVQSKLKA